MNIYTIDLSLNPDKLVNNVYSANSNVSILTIDLTQHTEKLVSDINN